MKGPEFLKKRFNLHTAPEVEKAATRTTARTGEKVSQNPSDRIENHLNRFKEIVERKDDEKKKLGLRALKKVLHDFFVIKPEDIPESHFRLLQQIQREQGLGTVEVTEEMRKDAERTIRADQRSSLNKWIDYLASADARYPDWCKYWAFRSVVTMSLYDKEKKQFGNRSKHTTAPFPDLNREALAYVVDAIQKKTRGEAIANPVQETADYYDSGKLVSDEQFQHLLSTENFAKYYAFVIEHVVADSTELLKITEGQWRFFPQESDAIEMAKTLQGHGTGWCVAGESTAEDYLSDGEFHIYYSNNPHGDPTIPRLSIYVSDGEDIKEVRGVAHEQNIDPYIEPVLDKKLSEFGSKADEWRRKSEDMRKLTEIDRKAAESEPLTKDEARFLYQVDREIEGFGYDRDPRIREILGKRNKLEDLKIAFDTKDSSEAIKLFLELGDKKIASILDVKTESGERDDENIDYEDFDPEIRDFLDSLYPSIEALSASAVEQMLDSGLRDVVEEWARIIPEHERFKVLKLVKEYDDSNGSDRTQSLVGEWFPDVPDNYYEKFIDEVVEKGDAPIFKELLTYDKVIPVDMAKKLLDANMVEVLTYNLHRFAEGLDSTVASALIAAGSIDKVAANLHLFRKLNRSVWEELEGQGFYSDIDKNPQSFDLADEERLKKNPFGQYVRENPFQ